jgi:hypothetical protein
LAGSAQQLLSQAIDLKDRIDDRGLRIGPGESDFDGCQRDAVDQYRLEIATPESRVPLASADLKRFDLEIPIGAGV